MRAFSLFCFVHFRHQLAQLQRLRVVVLHCTYHTNFSISTARDLVSDLNNIQVFLNCRPDGISDTCLQELANLQTDLIDQLGTVLCGIAIGAPTCFEYMNSEIKQIGIE